MAAGDEIKDRQRMMWSAGDYAHVAETIASVALELVDRIGIDGGQDVLDVACGTGNAAIPAAQRGAAVTGLDLTPKLLEIARDRSAAAGVEVSFVEGDAEALPFEDASFDRVTSVFGAMFAPDQWQTASELARVRRPDGRVGVCAWTPEGLNGRLFALMASYMPPPPADFAPPVLWGVEDHVRDLFAEHGLEPEFERRSVTFEADSIEEWVSFHENALGPIVLAKAALEPEGRWEEARGDLISLYAGDNENSDGTMRVQAEYLVTTLGGR